MGSSSFADDAPTRDRALSGKRSDRSICATISAGGCPGEAHCGSLALGASHCAGGRSEAIMPDFVAVGRSERRPSVSLGRGELLARCPIFRADDLDRACEHLSDAVAQHRLTYLTRDRRIDLRHRRMSLGPVVLNSLRYGGDVRVDAPDFPDYYLLQFMLKGGCRVSQAGRSYDMFPGSIAVINPRRPFEKGWEPSGRQLMLRIDRRLLDRELTAWIGREPKGPIEFDQSRPLAFAEATTLTGVVRILCNDLRGNSSALDHPFVRDRFASTLASALLIGLPHNHIRAIEAAGKSIAPASIRRAERFLEENAANVVGLTDVARAAGVSARALQLAFRRFRDTSPMAQLRALRLERARRALEDGDSVTSVAAAQGFGSLGRFEVNYKTRFGESPSETLRRGFWR
jgi:AraC-like DNA-binding protein